MSRQAVYLKQLILLIASLAVIVALSLLTLRACEVVGAKVGKPIGHQVEASLRDAIKAQLDYEPGFKPIKSKKLDDALEIIRVRLVSNPKAKLDWPIQIMAVDNPEINAVTLPGGLILVYRGLLRDARSAEEVAAVIAHELGHVSHSDSMNALTRNLVVAAALSGGGNASPQVIQEILHTLGESAFSRQVEDSADRYGLALLSAASLRPGHMADFFERMQSKKDENGLAKSLSWVSSHPDTASRIDLARQADSEFKDTEKPLGIDWPAIVDSLP